MPFQKALSHFPLPWLFEEYISSASIALQAVGGRLYVRLRGCCFEQLSRLSYDERFKAMRCPATSCRRMRTKVRRKRACQVYRTLKYITAVAPIMAPLARNVSLTILTWRPEAAIRRLAPGNTQSSLEHPSMSPVSPRVPLSKHGRRVVAADSGESSCAVASSYCSVELHFCESLLASWLAHTGQKRTAPEMKQSRCIGACTNGSRPQNALLPILANLRASCPPSEPSTSLAPPDSPECSRLSRSRLQVSSLERDAAGVCRMASPRDAWRESSPPSRM
ncbi:hypothetical protein CC78DRAFT_533318 [Lojkania enalia]|uniref:Uncharacterized protein n=1 Tax=Lojkania enalia TaxID=147567 RepID=A0A9P4MZX9_9PLEO|nr:hypothetical protein CC78DRAFT_533318 [Didymosphaeria enalia]